MSGYLALAVSVGLLAVLDSGFLRRAARYHRPCGACVDFVHCLGLPLPFGRRHQGLHYSDRLHELRRAGRHGRGHAGGAVRWPAPASWPAPIAVGLGAFVICLASKVPLLATIPASVYGFASVAGPILLAAKSPTEAIVPVICSVIIGAVFGIVSEKLAAALTKKPAPLRAEPPEAA